MKDLMTAIWMCLLNTPWWVYLILIYCIIVGIKCSKDGVVSIYKMLIIPIIFTLMSIETVYNNFTISPFVLMVYGGSVLVGALLGMLQGKLQNISVDKDKRLIHIPGTWSVMILIAIIFISKYYFGYSLGIDPALAQQTSFEVSMLAVSGVISGLFIGRVLYYFIRMSHGPYVSLHED